MTRQFNGLQFDCYQDENQNSSDNEFWATREQIGRLLGYAYPVEAIGKIHNRNKERLDKFSRVTQIDLPSGGMQMTTVYNFKGLLEICRYSNQPKADAVMDWLFEVAEEIRRTGSYSLKRKRKVAKKKFAPSLESIIDACEQFYHLALHCENNDDVKKVLALDEAFRRYTGESALEIAHFRLKCEDNYSETLSLEFNHPELQMLRMVNRRVREDCQSSEYLNMFEQWKMEQKHGAD